MHAPRRVRYSSTERIALSFRYGVSGTEMASGGGRRWGSLYARGSAPPMLLRACYAMSGASIAAGADPLCFRVAEPPTFQVHVHLVPGMCGGAQPLCESGTELGYGAAQA
eukprot:3537266-Rhodomonas_salina.2